MKHVLGLELGRITLKPIGKHQVVGSYFEVNGLMPDIFARLSACDLCKDRFAATVTGHAPRPVFQGEASAKVLIAGQAPGARVHQSGRPFTDPSGDRLRDWMGINKEIFYDETRIAILPMGFCFPGYDRKGADLPPPAICAKTWRANVLQAFPNIQFTLLVGAYAQKWHLSTQGSVTEVVARWRAHLPHQLPLPHPSWRNRAWIKKNPWFETDVLPALRGRLKEVLV